MPPHDGEVTRTQMSGTTYHRNTALVLPVLAIVFGTNSHGFVPFSFMASWWGSNGIFSAGIPLKGALTHLLT